MPIALDPHIRGVVESAAHPDGAVLARIIRGDLVLKPFTNSGVPAYSSDFTGSGGLTASVGQTLTNPDGSQSTTNLSTTSAFTTANALDGTELWQPFYGRVFAIRFRRDSATPDFSVMIDGVSYGVLGKDPFFAVFGSNVSDHAIIPITDDLKGGYHMARIALVGGPPANPAARTLVLYGYAVERREGHNRQNHLLYHGPTTGPHQLGSGTGNAEFLNSILPTSVNQTAIRGVVCHNTNGAAATVYIGSGGTGSANIVWEQPLGATGSTGGHPYPTETIDFLALTALANSGSSRMQIWASTTGVYAEFLGGL